jgi:uncharacterized protein (TIGR03067 family)
MIPVACLLIAAETKENTAKKDKEVLQGEWACVSIEVMGLELTGKDFEACKFDLVFKADKMLHKVKEGTVTCSYSLDPTTNPKSIDTVQEEDGKPVTTKGIYRLEKDMLTLCIRECLREGDERRKRTS